eukprot:g1268.t1
MDKVITRFGFSDAQVIRLIVMSEKNELPNAGMVRQALLVGVFLAFAGAVATPPIESFCNIYLLGSQAHNKSSTSKKKRTQTIWEMAYEILQFPAYFVFFLYGWTALIREPFFEDSDIIFEGWPFHALSSTVRMYYTIQLTGYIYLICLPYFVNWTGASAGSVERDTLAHLLHHVLTLSLIVASWTINCARIGSIVFLLHDVSSVALKFARFGHAAGWDTWRNVSFVLFAICFFVFRVCGMTFYAVPISLAAPTDAIGAKVVYPLNALLVCLTLLQYFWFYKTLKRILSAGGSAGGARTGKKEA